MRVYKTRKGALNIKDKSYFKRFDKLKLFENYAFDIQQNYNFFFAIISLTLIIIRLKFMIKKHEIKI